MRRVRDIVGVRAINLMDRLATPVSAMATIIECLRTQIASRLSEKRAECRNDFAGLVVCKKH